MAQKRPHDVHLRMACGAVATAALHLLEDHGSSRERQSGAAIFFWDQRRQIAGVGQCRNELDRIGAFTVEPSPILARKAGA